MRSIMGVVDKLDIRRLQVLVEAILVDISELKSAELGVNWAVGNTDSDSTVPIGSFNQTVGGSSIGSIAAAISDPDNIDPSLLPSGLTLGAGRFLDSGTNFALLLRALRGDGNTQHPADAFDHHPRQRRGGDQGRAGGAVPHRLVHEHRRRRTSRAR